MNSDRYNDIIKEAKRIQAKYKTPDNCKNETELNELEDAAAVLIADELNTAARRSCEVDG